MAGNQFAGAETTLKTVVSVDGNLQNAFVLNKNDILTLIPERKTWAL